MSDGASLIPVPNAAETVQMPFDKNPMRAGVPPDSAPTVFAAAPVVQTQPSRKSAGLIVAAILGFMLLLLIGGVAAFVLLRRPTFDKKSIIAASPSPIVSLAAAPVDETAALKEKLANLEKQARDRNNQKPTAPAEPLSPPNQAETTARVNSPRDGFLALRSEPNSETGYRITKIPHGATVTVLGCPKPSNAGKIAGRWCQVVYNDQSGWAFDAFMIF
ncbi:MAG: SH3 domain-containing protein [Acidobacteriota bacterium]|nr:SH3 domain-containing protein [Acidobacteriota bacterium]